VTTNKPNEEQRAIIRAVGTGEDVLTIAGAGTGKTSTAEMVARRYPRKRILYIAFNRAAKEDAQARMPGNVQCKTTHGLAFGPVGRSYSSRLNEGRCPSWKLAQVMGYRPIQVAHERLVQAKVASIVRRTVDRYCHSADVELHEGHVPWVSAWDADMNNELRAQIQPLAAVAWEDVMSQGGRFPFSHDSYLKIYQLGEPKLNFDLVILDEAQDTNPCVGDIVIRQQGRCQLQLVGDPNQAIYEWRGAKDYMEGFQAAHTLMLTGSYRFGPDVAEEANEWLERLGSDLRLKGYKKLASEVTRDELDNPSAILTRGNAGAIFSAMAGLKAGKRVAIVGGSGPIALLARAAASLKAGAATDHPDLVAFQNWREVQKYVKEEREDAGSLAPLVAIVDSMGTDAILQMCNELVDESRGRPDLVVSTAHKAKGREWDHVQVGDDFTPPKEGEEPRQDELRLSYVTVTRAKLTLGLGSLEWPKGPRTTPPRLSTRDNIEGPFELARLPITDDGAKIDLAPLARVGVLPIDPGNPSGAYLVGEHGPELIGINDTYEWAAAAEEAGFSSDNPPPDGWEPDNDDEEN
jgi:superfamily I DNA/RNA helicase